MKELYLLGGCILLVIYLCYGIIGNLIPSFKRIISISYLCSKGKFSENSDGSFVSIKDNWVYFTTKEKEIYPIISYEMFKNHIEAKGK